MKRVVTVTNFIRDPSIASANPKTFWLFNRIGNWSYGVTNTDAKVGSTSLCATALTSGPTDTFGPYQSYKFSVVGGQKIALSFWVKPSFDSPMQALIEQDVGGTKGSAVNYCPANVWTRISGIVTTSTGATLARPVFYSTSGGTYAVGDTVLYDGFMVTATDFIPDYHDGDSPNWTWSGAPNASVSSGPVMTDAPVLAWNGAAWQNTMVRTSGGWVS